MNPVFYFTEFMMNGFTLTAIVFFPLYFIARQQRKEIQKLMIISAFFLIAAASLYFITMMASVIFNLITIKNDEYDSYVFLNRCFGPYWFAYWLMFLCAGLAPQVLWIRKFRKSPWIFILLIPFLNIGHWMELLISLIARYSHSFLPTTWNLYWRYTDVLLVFFLYVILLVIVYLITRKKEQCWKELQSTD